MTQREQRRKPELARVVYEVNRELAAVVGGKGKRSGERLAVALEKLREARESTTKGSP